MTPDPLPVALPELPTVAYEYESEDPYDSGELMLSHVKPERRNVSPLVRKSDAEAALRAQAEELAALRADAERLDFLERAWFFKSSEGYIEFAFNECWDAGRHDNLRAAIDVHLAASKQEKPHG